MSTLGTWPVPDQDSWAATEAGARDGVVTVSLPARIGLCPEHGEEFYLSLDEEQSARCPVPGCGLAMVVYVRVGGDVEGDPLIQGALVCRSGEWVGTPYWLARAPLPARLGCLHVVEQEAAIGRLIDGIKITRLVKLGDPERNGSLSAIRFSAASPPKSPALGAQPVFVRHLEATFPDGAWHKAYTREGEVVLARVGSDGLVGLIGLVRMEETQMEQTR